MDIWSWVSQAQEELSAQGQVRLADLMDELPSAVVDDDIAKVDAIVPEALALAQNQSNPWIEVFVRHWNLQSRVLRRDEGQGQLQEAISLLDYASQESTRDCPQSICVVQDLASCYENVDDIGYAPERLAVAQESLARINPRWNCYTCITTELLTAKKSLGLYEEVLKDIQRERRILLEADPEDTDTPFTLIEAEVLGKLGRFDEAIQVLRNTDHPAGGKHFRRSRDIALSSVYAKAGQFDKARQYLLPFQEIKNAMVLGHDWCDACFELTLHGEIDNNWRLHHFFEQLCQKWLELGCLRTCFDNTAKQAKLAIQRGQAASLQHCIERLREVAPQLRTDAGASATLAELEQALLEMPKTELNSTDPATLLETLPEDPEQRLSLLDSGLARWPEAEALALEKMATLAMLEQNSHAFAEQYLHMHPNSPEVLKKYGFDHPNPDFLEQLGEHELTQETRLLWHWIVGNHYRHADEYEQALQHYQAILTIQPDAINTLAAAANMAIHLHRPEQALAYQQRLLELDEDNDSTRWDILVSTTLTGQWSEVRKQARILGMDVEEGDTPIKEQWSWVRIAWKHEDGETVNYRAIRTGPVTARITATSKIGQSKTYATELVFDPFPLNRLDETDDNGNPVDSEGYDNYLFAMLTETGGEQHQWQRYDLEGVYPGDEHWNQLLEGLSQLDIALHMRSSIEYALEYEGKELQAIYAYLMVPVEMSLQSLDQHLLTLTTDFEHPFIWPLLSYLSGDETIQQRTQEITEKYAISDNGYEHMDQTKLT